MAACRPVLSKLRTVVTCGEFRRVPVRAPPRLQLEHPSHESKSLASKIGGMVRSGEEKRCFGSTGMHSTKHLYMISWLVKFPVSTVHVQYGKKKQTYVKATLPS